MTGINIKISYVPNIAIYQTFTEIIKLLFNAVNIVGL